MLSTLAYSSLTAAEQLRDKTKDEANEETQGGRTLYSLMLKQCKETTSYAI